MPELTSSVLVDRLAISTLDDIATLPRPARIYTTSVVALGILLISIGVLRTEAANSAVASGLLALALLTSASRVSLPLTGGGANLTLSYIAAFSAVLTVGTWPSVLIAAVAGWGQCTFQMRARHPHHTLFTMSTLAISAAAAGASFLVTVPPVHLQWGTQIGTAAIAATAYYLVNTTISGIAASLTSRERTPDIWRKRFLWGAPNYYIGAALAVVLVQLARGGLQWWAAILLLPVYLTYRSFRAYSDRIAEEQRQVIELADVQLATIEALTLAIEAKDRTSHSHLQRMQAYSAGLARALGMSETEIRGVKTAALLHDIGNLAVPEHILSKTTRLSDEEYERLKIHPRVGAEIVRAVPFPYPVATLILSHHERWDGRGYPAGQKGLEIPTGSRILAVADCFTAMISGRPHRPGRTYAEAIATLRENGGTSLDPALVERFIEILPDVEYQLHGGKPLTDASKTAPKSDVDDQALSDIAVAHREEQMLHDISQALSSSLRVSDTLALVSSSMVECVPFASCGLFLFDEESQLFICRHISGIQHEGIRALVAGRIETLTQMLPAAPAQTRGVVGTRMQSVLVAPLQIGDDVIGALALYHTERNAFTPEHRRLLGRIAVQASPVVANAMVFERTQEQSLTDVLTGLPNRRYLDRQFSQELSRAERSGEHVSVLVLDMDRFKQINDGFGHQAGDRALKEVAQVLRSSLRVYDACARFAGDEFVVILGNCDAAQAERRRQELQSSVAAIPFDALPDQRISLGISAGAASFPEDGKTVEEMIAVADRRMYADKAARKSVPAEAGRTGAHLW